MDRITWQKAGALLTLLVLSVGGLNYTDLFGVLFQLKGIEYNYTGDIICGSECESYIDIETSYWRVCFAGYDDTKYENETLFKKVSRSRTLHVNMDNVKDIITTQRLLLNGSYEHYDIEVDWLVPARGKGNWRSIKDGDCWDRKKVNRIKLVGHKNPEETIRWSFGLGEDNSYVDIDPLWIGAEKEHLNHQTDIQPLGNNRFAQTSGLGLINYRKGTEFNPIDLTLEDYGDYWKTTKSIYHPTIPKHSDGWFGFNNLYGGNNHTIKTRPVTDKVRGILDTTTNSVLYKDAFGKGMDLEVKLYNSHLLKQIVINEPQNKKLWFDFELDIDAGLSSSLVDNDKSKIRVTDNRIFKQKQIEFRKDKTPTYIFPMKVWDSNGSVGYIDAKIYEKGGKTYLQKIISKEFLADAVYPVYTDDDTGVTSPGTMADDDAVGTRTWSNPDNAMVSDDSDASAIAVSEGTVNTHYLKATNFGFSIPDGATIDGILVEVEKASNSVANPPSTKDNEIKIIMANGTIGSTNKADTSTLWITDDGYISHGNSTDLWGESWSASDINNVSFGVVISAVLVSTGGGASDCLSKSTLIYTQFGEKEIQTLIVGDIVYSFNEMTNSIELDRISAVHSRPIIETKSRFYNINLSNGRLIRATYNEKFYMDGLWIEAQNLEKGDFLLSLDLERIEIISIIIEENTIEYVWDLTIEKNHNFFAEKVLVHNLNALAEVDHIRMTVYYTAADSTPPTYSQNSTNSTEAGSDVLHALKLEDETALDVYIFSFDNGTGTLVNDSLVDISGVLHWSNVTKRINHTVGSTIRWQVFANDTNNNWNATPIYTYTATDTVAPTIDFVSPTPANDYESSVSYAYINTTVSDLYDTTSFIDWNNSLVGWWKMNEGSGSTITDSSTYGNDGTLYPSTSGQDKWVTGKIGNALDMDGTNDYVEVGTTGLLATNGTVCMWVQPDTLDTTPQTDNLAYLYTHYTGGGNRIYLRQVDASLKLVMGSTHNIDEGIDFELDTWSHICVAYNGTDVTSYEDGVNYGTSAYADLSSISSYATIGCGKWSSTNVKSYFNGIIDDVLIYNYSLTDSEIADAYTQGRDGLETNISSDGLVMWTKLDESGTIDTADDSSDNSNTGTLYGYPIQWTEDGKFDDALMFDGVEDYINLGNGASLDIENSDHTVEFWGYLTGASNPNDNIIVGQVGYNNGFILRASDNKVKYSRNYHDTGICYVYALSSADDGWHHYVGGYDSTTNKIFLYMDGVLQGEMTKERAFKSLSNWYIGGRSSSVYCVEGQIDEAKIHNRALSEEEINASYDSGTYRLYHNFTDLSNGVYDYTAHTQDASGNVNSTTRNITIALDTCSCPASGVNWGWDFADNCTIATNCDIGTGKVYILNSNAGKWTINAVITASKDSTLNASDSTYITGTGHLNLTVG